MALTSVTFLPDETTKTVTVLVNGDTTFEADETFTVHLSNAIGRDDQRCGLGQGRFSTMMRQPSFAIDDVTPQRRQQRDDSNISSR